MTEQLPTHVDGTEILSSDPEVTPRPRRRNFSVSYKAALLAELDNCSPGEIGAILRREGVYSSSISEWRQQRRDGCLGTAKRGPPKMRLPSGTEGEAQELRRENRRLKRELETALLAIEIQKKVALLMDLHRCGEEFLPD